MSAQATSRGWRPFQAKGSPAALVLSRAMLVVVGIAILVAYCSRASLIPLVGVKVAAIAVVYALLLIALPRVWLVVLPAVTVAVDLAPWTGHFIFSEFDVFVAATLAAMAMGGRFKGSLGTLVAAPVLFFLGYLCVYLLNVEALGAFLRPPTAVVDNPYYTGAYSYKVGKGLVWATLLGLAWLSLYRDDPPRTIAASLGGALLAATLMFVLGLWERGTLALLASDRSLWFKASALLDLNADYRVTGIFADMHTGGEVIDGILLLLLPLTLAGVLRCPGIPTRLICLSCFAAVWYVILIGFTRATYVTGAFATLATLAAHFAVVAPGGRPRGARLFLLLALALGISAAQLALYPLAGMKGALAIAWTVLGIGIAHRLSTSAAALGCSMIAVCAIGLWSGVDAHFDSDYVTATAPSTLYVTALVMATAMMSYAASYFSRPTSYRAAGSSVRSDRGTAAGPDSPSGHFSWEGLSKNYLTALTLLAALPAGLALASSGYGIGERLQTVESDLQTRWDHWSRVVESAEDSPKARWLGNGVGSFPRRYVAAFPRTLTDVGSFLVDPEAGAVTLGVGRDLTLTQRVGIDPATEYAINIAVRSAGTPKLLLRLCEHNQLFFTNWPPRCVRQRFEPRSPGMQRQNVDPAAQHFTVSINSANVGNLPPWLRKPVALQVANWADQPVTISSLELTGGRFTGLRNGDFREGLDHWFFMSDQRHLPWHVKNLWLQAWYETGWIGLGLLVLLLAITGMRAWRLRRTAPLMLYIWLAPISVVIFGAFGSPLDSARVSLWFYMLLFIVAGWPTKAGARAPATANTTGLGIGTGTGTSNRVSGTGTGVDTHMKPTLKALAALMARLMVLPLLLLWWLGQRLQPSGADSLFAALSQALSLLPGKTGSYLRLAFYHSSMTRCERDSFIGFGTLFSQADTEIGPGVYIGPQCNIGRCAIGPNTLLASGVHIMSGTRQHVFDDLDTPIREQGGEFHKVYIGEDCWIGNGALVMANVGNHCVIGAGAVVSKDIPDYAIAAGSPARVVRLRKRSRHRTSVVPAADLSFDESPWSRARFINRFCSLKKTTLEKTRHCPWLWETLTWSTD